MKSLPRYVSVFSMATLLTGGVAIAQSSETTSSSSSRETTSSSSTVAPAPAPVAPANTFSSTTRSTDTVVASSTDPLAVTVSTAEFNSRAQLASNIERQIDMRSATLDDLKDNQKLEGNAKADFKAARKEVEDRADAVKRDLRAIRNSSNGEWTQVRSRLATDYAAYQAAVTRAEIAAGVSPNSTPLPSPNSTDRTYHKSETNSSTTSSSSSP